MKKKVVSILLIMMLVISTFTTFSFAGNTKTMTVYSQVVKSGNTVFVIIQDGISGDRLYKINLKKRTSKNIDYAYNLGSMRAHRGYLYYLSQSYNHPDDDFADQELYRIKISKGNPKRVCSTKSRPLIFKYSWKFKYALTKSRIYYNDTGGSKILKRSVSLTGKKKKATKIKVINKTRKSNAKGYAVYVKEDTLDWDTKTGEIVYYLKKPGKDIEIATLTWDELYYDVEDR